MNLLTAGENSFNSDPSSFSSPATPLNTPRPLSQQEEEKDSFSQDSEGVVKPW